VVEKKKGASPTNARRPRAAKTTQKQKKEPEWAKTFLDAIRHGKTIKFAAMLAGVARSTAQEWIEKSTQNRAAYTRARDEQVAEDRDFCMDVLKAHAVEGSSWHLARYWAARDMKGWKSVQRRIAKADPDRIPVEVTGSGSGLTAADLFKHIHNGNGSKDGNGSGDSK
jgi:hypothetical protein